MVNKLSKKKSNKKYKKRPKTYVFKRTPRSIVNKMRGGTVDESFPRTLEDILIQSRVGRLYTEELKGLNPLDITEKILEQAGVKILHRKRIMKVVNQLDVKRKIHVDVDRQEQIQIELDTKSPSEIRTFYSNANPLDKHFIRIARLRKNIIKNKCKNVLILISAFHGSIKGVSKRVIPENNSWINWVNHGECGYRSSRATTLFNSTIQGNHVNIDDIQSHLFSDFLIDEVNFLENGKLALKDDKGCLTSNGEGFLDFVNTTMSGWSAPPPQAPPKSLSASARWSSRMQRHRDEELSLGIYIPGDKFNNMNFAPTLGGIKLHVYFLNKKNSVNDISEKSVGMVQLTSDTVKYTTGIDTITTEISQEQLIYDFNKIFEDINSKQGEEKTMFYWMPSTSCRVINCSKDEDQLTRTISQNKNNSLECFLNKYPGPTTDLLKEYLNSKNIKTLNELYIYKNKGDNFKDLLIHMINNN